MTRLDSERVEALFAEALSRPPEQWASYLETAIDSAEVRREVLSLLLAHQRKGRFDSLADQLRGDRLAAASVHLANFMDRVKTALAERYRLERELGRGGMATVWLAHDVKHDRPVALKVMRPELAAALGSERFLREITVTARLHHPHILTLLDSGEADGVLYYAMPYVEGESLRERLTREKQLPLEEALQIAREVADALGYAHSHDVVHRDIKPENILLESGHALVADFGIARAITAAGGTTLTETGLVVGTPAYMSPEQGAGSGELDGRSDLYSLGCVLYEMLSGETPYTGPTPQAILAKKLSEPLPRISVVRETVPAPIEAALTKALARAPADRFRTASEFVAALAVDIEAHRRRERRRAWTRKLAVGAVAIAAVAAATWGVVRYQRAAAWKAEPVNSNTVAVMPFRATATDPALDKLGEMMMDLLFGVLTGDVGPRAVEPGSLLRKWSDMTARGEATASDAPLKLAAYFGAGLLLEGSAVQAGSQLTVNAWLRAVPQGRELARTTVVASVDSLPGLPRRLVVALLGHLLGDDAERVSGLEAQDPEAVQAYLAGVQAYRAGAYRKATDQFSRAVARDSTFALAALALARATGADVAVADQVGVGALHVAERFRGRLSKRDQAELEVLNVDYVMGIGLREELAIYERWVAASPDNPEAWQNYGFVMNGVGAPLGILDWRSRASRAWEAAWVLDSVTPASVAWLARWGTHMGDLAWLRRVGPQYLAVADTTTDWWPAQRWAIAIAQGDSATVRELRARAQAGDPRVANRRVAWTAMLLSIAAGLPLDDADLFIRQALARATTADSGAILNFYSVAAQALGRMRGAVAAVTDPRLGYFRELSPLRAPRLWIYLLDLWLMYPGLDSVAAVAADSLRAWGPSGREFAPGSGVSLADARSYPLVYRAAQGDTVGVRSTVRRIQSEFSRGVLPAIGPLLAEALVESHDSTVTSTPALDRLESAERSANYFLPHLALVARLRRVRGQADRALAAARARFFGWAHDFQVFTPFLREEGYAAAAVGDTAAAIRAFTHYLTLKTDPDPGPATQERDEVRAALERLRRGRGPR